MTSPKTPEHRSDSSSSRPASETRVVPSDDILQGSREVLIRHAEEVYRLRVTRSGKLILHK